MNSPNNQKGNQTSRQVLPFSTAWSPDYQELTPSKGFVNPSVLCYRNSALCVILHSPVLINWLALHYGDQGCGKLCVLCRLHRLVVSFWKGDSDGDDPEAALLHVWDLLLQGGWDGRNLAQQQDVREFLENVFGQMYDNAEGMEPFDLNKVLKITINKSSNCKKCGKVTQISQPDQEYFCVAAFAEDPKGTGPVHIEGLLRNCYSGVNMERACEQCQSNTDHFVAENVTEIPEILLVHLNRVRTNNTAKSSKRISLSDQMVLPDSLRRGLSDKDDICYELYIIIFHHGRTINSGHYTAAVRAPAGKWILMDDDKEAEPMRSLATLMNMGRGQQNYSASAYVCAYRRLPLEGKSMPPAYDSKQLEGDESASSQQVSDQAHAMPLDETSSTDPAVLAVPDAEIAPSSSSSLSPPPPSGSLTPRQSPVRPGVTMDGTLSFDGRDVEWTLQQQLAIPSDAGPLIKLKPRAKVQRANIRLTLTSGEEILEGEVTISLKPKEPQVQAQRPSKATKTTNTRAKRTTRAAAQKKKESPTSNKQARPEGVKKRPAKARDTKPKHKPSDEAKNTKAGRGQTKGSRKKG